MTPSDESWEAVLYRAAADRPGDDTPRLALADRLDAAGRGVEAGYVRLALALGRLAPGLGVGCGAGLPGQEPHGVWSHDARGPHGRAWLRYYFPEHVAEQAAALAVTLDACERELLGGEVRGGWARLPAGGDGLPVDVARWRGLPEAAAADWPTWLRMARCWQLAPVRAVTLLVQPTWWWEWPVEPGPDPTGVRVMFALGGAWSVVLPRLPGDPPLDRAAVAGQWLGGNARGFAVRVLRAVWPRVLEWSHAGPPANRGAR